jgi:hypothetical protein
MNLDPGGIVGVVLCVGMVIFIAFMTGRKRGRRRPAGAPIYRRNPSYRRRLRRAADDSDGSGGSGGSDGGGWGGWAGSHDSGGSSCGGGGGGGD